MCVGGGILEGTEQRAPGLNKNTVSLRAVQCASLWSHCLGNQPHQLYEKASFSFFMPDEKYRVCD